MPYLLPAVQAKMAGLSGKGGMASLGAQLIKNLPVMQETWVQSLGWDDPLKKEMAIHSSKFLPGKSHGQRSLAGYSPWSCKRVGHD